MSYLVRCVLAGIGFASIYVTGADTFDKMTMGDYFGCLLGSALIYIAYAWPYVFPIDPETTREDM